MYKNCDCEVYRDLRAAKAKREEAIEDRAMLVRVVDAIARHLGVDVDAVIEDPSVAIAAHTAAIAAEREACAALLEGISRDLFLRSWNTRTMAERVQTFKDAAKVIRARGYEVKP